MKYNIYYITDRKQTLRRNITLEEAREYLKSLTYAEKTHIHIEECIEREEEDER